MAMKNFDAVVDIINDSIVDFTIVDDCVFAIFNSYEDVVDFLEDVIWKLKNGETTQHTQSRDCHNAPLLANMIPQQVCIRSATTQKRSLGVTVEYGYSTDYAICDNCDEIINMGGGDMFDYTEDGTIICWDCLEEE